MISDFLGGPVISARFIQQRFIEHVLHGRQREPLEFLFPPAQPTLDIFSVLRLRDFLCLVPTYEALVTSKQSLLVTFELFPNSYHSHSKN